MDIFTGSFTQQEPLSDAAIDAALGVMRTGRLHRYNLSPGEEGEVSLLEKDFAAFTGARFCVAVASGGAFKSKNAGTTFEPIFDNYSSYSIGCVTIDPSNSNTVWVGTGENNGGRHIGFGDGIYVSHNGGKSFTNMGLKKSEHLSKILVHPRNCAQPMHNLLLEVDDLVLKLVVKVKSTHRQLQ